jgi:hypothetical protein
MRKKVGGVSPRREETQGSYCDSERFDLTEER